MLKPTNQNSLAGEVTAFLRNLHDLNKSIYAYLSPMLESQYGIDLRLYFILHIIRNGVIYPSAIAQAIYLPNSLVTKHLDQLAAKDFLTRSLDPKDSRRIRVTLSEKGERLIREADATFVEVVGKRLEGLQSDRRSSFFATLAEIVQDTDWR